MSKLTLTPVSNILGNPNSAANTINNNNDAIVAALEKTLSRDGTIPNTMTADLDMNGNQILNVPAPVSDTDLVRQVDVLPLVEELFVDITQGPVGPPSTIPGPVGPAGPPAVARGDYSGAVQYLAGDLVNNNSSSWIAIVDTIGNAPPTLPTTTNTWWTLVAAQGPSGPGTGDVTGPASSVDNELALMSGTSGKSIKRATTTGIIKTTSGVIGTATAGTDYIAPGAGNADSSVSAASTTTQGKVELAIASEVDTATDATRAITPDALAGSIYGRAVISILVFDLLGNVAAGNAAGNVFWRVPSTLNGWTLVSTAAQVYTAGTGSALTINIRNVTDNVSMLSSAMQIDSGELDTSTGSSGTINGSANTVSTGEQLRVDVVTTHSTPAKGLVVELQFEKI